MKSEIEDFYSLYRKARAYFLRSITGLDNEEKRTEFTDNLMLQLLVLWILQSRNFFNKDKSYFITKFREFQTNCSFKVNSYFEFLQYFLKNLNINKNEDYFEDEIVGRIIVPGPVIFFPDISLPKEVSIPKGCFYEEEKTKLLIKTPPNRVSGDVPLFNLFESREKNINEFIFGAIYEKFINLMEKKSSGAYYTPEEISSYTCKTTIERCLIERINEKFDFRFKSIDSSIEVSNKKVIKYLFNQLEGISILDPAVGTGHFLESSINVLLEIHTKVWRTAKEIGVKKGMEIITIDTKGNSKPINLLEISDEKLFKLYVLFFLILSKNVYGVDINQNVLRITQTRLFLLLTQYFDIDRKNLISLSDVHFNLKQGNSLLGYIKLEKAKTAKQLSLESYLSDFEPPSYSKLTETNSELNKYLQQAANALHIEESFTEDVGEIALIFAKKEITQKDLQNVSRINQRLLQILLVSLDPHFRKLLRDLLLRVTGIFKDKLNELFSLQFNIDLNRLNTLKIFHWINEFPNVFLEKGGFDVIIANPPYLGESGNKELFRIYATALREYYEGKMDLWYLFLHRSIDLIIPGAYSSIISSNYWVTATGAAKLRNRLLEDICIEQYINFGENRVFSNAQGIHTNIITFRKVKKPNRIIDCVLFNQTYPLGTDLFQRIEDQLHYTSDQKQLVIKNWDPYIHFLPKNIRTGIEEITNNSQLLKLSGFYVKEGIVTGLNNITRKQAKKYRLMDHLNGVGVFILDKDNIQDFEVMETFTEREQEHIRPFYKNSDISRYHTTIPTTKNILYLNRNTIDIEKLPNIKIHLDKFREILENSLDNPPYVNRPRTQEIFTSPKIVTPQRSLRNTFAYNSFNWHAGQDVYYILNEDNNREKLKRLLLILNSKLAYFWLYWMGKRKGKQLELFGEPLGYFPVHIELENHPKFAILSDYLCFLSRNVNISDKFQHIREFIQNQICDSLVFELYFKEKFCEDGLYPDNNPFLLEIIPKALKPIQYDQWIELHYEEHISKGLRNQNKPTLKILEKENFKTIEEVYNSLKNNQRINEHINQVKSHSWVQKIEMMM